MIIIKVIIIITIDKKERKGIILDIAVPADVRVGEKEREKVEKHQDLKREIGRLWKLKMVGVVPVVIGALGSVSKGFDRWIEKLGIPLNVGIMRNPALLGTARILRKVLEMWRKDNSVSLWSFVMTLLTEENTAMTTARTWCWNSMIIIIRSTLFRWRVKAASTKWTRMLMERCYIYWLSRMQNIQNFPLLEIVQL